MTSFKEITHSVSSVQFSSKHIVWIWLWTLIITIKCHLQFHNKLKVCFWKSNSLMCSESHSFILWTLDTKKCKQCLWLNLSHDLYGQIAYCEFVCSLILCSNINLIKWANAHHHSCSLPCHHNKNWIYLNIKLFEWMWMEMKLLKANTFLGSSFYTQSIKKLFPFSISLAHFCVWKFHSNGNLLHFFHLRHF